MRPLTDRTPKPLLKVAGKMLIEFHLEKLRAANITDVVVNHAWLGQQIEQALGNGSRYGLNIQYSAEMSALETAGGIIHALPLLGHDPFLVINADIYCEYNFADLPGKISGLAHLVLVNNPPQHPEGDFVLTPSQQVKQNNGDKLTFSGIGIYKPALFKDCSAGKQALAPLLRLAMDQQQVSGEFYQGIWHDIGTAERLAELEKIV